MADKVTAKDNQKEISPYRGAIELIQVGSVLLIPVGWLLLPDRRWAGAAWSLAALLALLPFYVAAVQGKKAQAKANAAEKARVEAAEKAKDAMAEVAPLSMVVVEIEEVEIALRNVEKKEPGQGVESAPYHSSRAGTKVYHIFSDCFLGNDIEKKYWASGMGDKTLCDRCEEMKREKEKEEAA
jgi:hypothetical protein